MSTAGAPAGENREGRIARSWRLTKASRQVVREDRVILLLALLPTLFGVAGVAVIFGAHAHRHLVDGYVLIVILMLAYPLMSSAHSSTRRSPRRGELQTSPFTSGKRG
jgi:hypothetical protein